MEKNTNLATSSTSAAQDTSKNCQVTNQTSSDAVVIIPTTSQDGSNDSSIAVYDQNLEILIILTTRLMMNFPKKIFLKKISNEIKLFI